MTLRRMVVVVAVIGFTVLLGGVLLMNAARTTSPYAPIPESVWAPPDNLELLKTEAIKGNSCCEPNAGGRIFWFKSGEGETMSSMTAFTLRSLRDDGWAGEHCDHSPKWYCLTMDDLNAEVGPAKVGPNEADLQVEFHRALAGTMA
ncbi:MAG: hypothetical protein ACJ73L_07245 [Actinomycetes bacterium]